MDLLTKYNINIVDETIYLWEDTECKNNINIETLNDLCINSKNIKIAFSINYKYSEILTFTNPTYFKIKDFLKIIFNFYNGLLSENEKTLFKKKKLETRKDLLIDTTQIYLESILFENDIYYIQIS